MNEDQSGVKPYIFNLYPEETAAVDAFAKAHCRGNRSEAVRRMIALAMRHTNLAVTEQYVAQAGSLPPTS
jgi:hypothetical protein